MKKQNKFWIAISAVAMSIASCDSVDIPEPPENPPFYYREDLYGTAPTPPTIDAMTQRVLLEDFTGHDCGNCPAAHIAAAEILEDHPEDVALVAIHAGSLAEPFGEFVDDWRTTEGEYYLLEQIGIDQLPTGRVNRVGGATTSTNFSTWSSEVDAQLAETPVADLAFSAELMPANNHLNIHLRAKYAQNISGTVKLVIMLAQGPIIAPQLNYAVTPSFIEEYEHKHMLRGTGTGASGLTAAVNPTAGQEDEIHYTLDWNPEWIAEDVEIIAFLTYGNLGEVINVRKIELAP
jgi:hypothetical protein